MLTIVMFLWRNGERTQYLSEHVNVTKRMVASHLSLPHEFVCCTDDGAGLDPDIRVVPIDTSLIPLGNAFPKLMAFRPDADKLFGKRICVIDIDCVVTGSLDPLLAPTDDFVIWKDGLSYPNRSTGSVRYRFNSSLILMDAGARSEVWETFDPAASPGMLAREKWGGSDQAWISRTLMGDEKVFTARSNGVLSWRWDVENKGLPENARIVFFHGARKPWHFSVGQIDFIDKCWYSHLAFA